MIRRSRSLRDQAIFNLYAALMLTTMIFRPSTGGTSDVHTWSDWVMWVVAMFYTSALFGFLPNFVTHIIIDRGYSTRIVAWTAGVSTAMSTFVVNGLATILFQNGVAHTSPFARVIYFVGIVLTVALAVWYPLRIKKDSKQAEGKQEAIHE